MEIYVQRWPRSTCTVSGTGCSVPAPSEITSPRVTQKRLPPHEDKELTVPPLPSEVPSSPHTLDETQCPKCKVEG